MVFGLAFLLDLVESLLDGHLLLGLDGYLHLGLLELVLLQVRLIFKLLQLFVVVAYAVLHFNSLNLLQFELVLLGLNGLFEVLDGVLGGYSLRLNVLRVSLALGQLCLELAHLGLRKGLHGLLGFELLLHAHFLLLQLQHGLSLEVQLLLQIADLSQAALRLDLELAQLLLGAGEVLLERTLLVSERLGILLLALELLLQSLLQLSHVSHGLLLRRDLTVQLLDALFLLRVLLFELAEALVELGETLFVLLKLLRQLAGVLLFGAGGFHLLLEHLFALLLRQLSILVGLSNLCLCHFNFLCQLALLMLQLGLEFVGDLLEVLLLFGLLFLERLLRFLLGELVLFVNLAIKVSLQVMLKLCLRFSGLFLCLSQLVLQLLVVLLCVVQGFLSRLKLCILILESRLFFFQFLLEFLLGLLVGTLRLGQGSSLLALRRLEFILQLLLDVLDVAGGLLELGLDLGSILLLKFLFDVRTLTAELRLELLLGLLLE